MRPLATPHSGQGRESDKHLLSLLSSFRAVQNPNPFLPKDGWVGKATCLQGGASHITINQIQTLSRKHAWRLTLDPAMLIILTFGAGEIVQEVEHFLLLWKVEFESQHLHSASPSSCLRFQRIHDSLLTSMGTSYACVTHIYMQTKHLCTQKLNKVHFF